LHSFVSLAEATPYDLDSLAEGMQLRGAVFTPAKENNQALATGHDQCATQFAFFHRQCRIVLGYEHDDALFKRGDGQPVTDSAYGVVVVGPTESVEAHARRAGSGAVIHQVVPLLLTAIFCSGP
jgi:hypothetical protein